MWPDSIRACFRCILLLSSLFITTIARAEEALSVEKQELADLLAQAQTYQLRLPKEKVDAVMRETALLNFTNPERNQEQGSVFVWLHGSRPVAVGQLFRYNARSARNSKHAFHSLTSSPLVASYDGTVRWSPTSPGITWKTIADAPEPAATHAARLLQIRQLARRYQLTLTSPKGDKTELRLITRPLFDYEAPADGILSGAMSSFVIATDPEALLLVEAFKDGKTTGFRYGFARMHFQQLVAMDGDTEVWRADYDPAMINNPAGHPSTVSRIYNSFVPP